MISDCRSFNQRMDCFVQQKAAGIRASIIAPIILWSARSSSVVNPFQPVFIGTQPVQLTACGLGTAALGHLYAPVPTPTAMETLAYAYDAGIRYFDTAVLYGSGRAEARLGAALARWPRAEITISSKVGYRLTSEELPADDAVPAPVERDYSYDGTLRSIEGSLRRLGISQLDIAFIHDPDEHLHEAATGSYPALQRLRDEGVIKLIGAGMNHSDLLADLAQRVQLDCILLAGRYTLLDQRALHDLLPIATAQNIAIIIGGPFNSGILANPYAAEATFNYAAAPQEWLHKARQLATLCDSHNIPLKAAALQFPLAHPAVRTVLSGARTAQELAENLAMFQVEIPAAFWAELRQSGLLDEAAALPHA
jgi:D-threo-aldose 1-dehydrogenase